MKNLYISEILLISRKEKKARRIKFDRRRTLIYGKNHTGKSSLIKSIYRTFGAEPHMHPKFLEADVACRVKFEIEGSSYQVIRDGRLFAIFDGHGNLLKTFRSITNELAPYFSDLFDFAPLFENHQNTFMIPPPAYLLLPYYVDQDKSWLGSWSAFEKLTQFKDYRNQCVRYHSGIRPNAYYQKKQELDIYLKAIEEADKEQKVTQKILKDLQDEFSQSQFNIDVDSFKNEINELLAELEVLKDKEEKLKAKLHDLHHIKSTYDIQIEVIKRALLESNRDLEYAIGQLPEKINCPTCGATYGNSFAERFEIAQDEQRCKDLLIEVKEEADEIMRQIEDESNKLSRTSAELARIDEILQSKKGELQLKDVIESAGKNQIRSIFSDKNSALSEIIVENAIQKEKLEKQLKGLESKEAKEKINGFFVKTLMSFLRELDVFSIREDDVTGISTRLEKLETGSSKPRALIAYYFAFFHLMKQFSTTTYFPLIIDSPNQQDQDIEHIDKIMGFINSKQPEDSQMILGVAETYGVDFGCPVVELNEKHSLLRSDEYDEIHTEINDKLFEMWSYSENRLRL